MFGYIKPKPSELLVKDYEFYKATYCGICRSMSRHTGALSCISLSYDSVFLALVRMIYVPDEQISAKRRNCITHPIRKRPILSDNDAVEYTARAFAIFSYHKLRDDMADEGAMKKMLLAPATPVLKGGARRADMKELAQLIADKLDEIAELENQLTPSVDAPGAVFGELLGEVFAHGFDGTDRRILYECGYHLGKFIYAADAAEDYDKDVKKGKYNPYALTYGKDGLTPENKSTIKLALMLECKKIESAVNLMPFGNRATIENIIRNILYFGLPERLSFLDTKPDEPNPEKENNLLEKENEN